MPLIRSSVFKCLARRFKLVAVILLLSKIMPTYSCCAEKGLVYITIITLSGRQPSFYMECIKLNIRSFCNVCLIFNIKYMFLTRLYAF